MFYSLIIKCCSEEEWAQCLAPLLSNKAQHVYLALPLADAKDYNKLKEEILARCGLSPCQAVAEFHQWTYQPSLMPWNEMDTLLRINKCWLQFELHSIT